MLKKSTLREIRTSLARYLAIFSIVALGVGFFSGLKDCKDSMVSTARRYLSDHNFYDYTLATSYGIDEGSIEIARAHEGVSGAEGSVQIDVMASTGGADAVALKAISLPEDINTIRLVEGRLPENNSECVIDNYSIGTEGYEIGQTILLTEDNDKDTLKEFKSKEFEIVGMANTPLYLDYQRGSTDIGNGSLGTFFYVQKDVFDVDYYTQLYVTLDGQEEAFSQESEDFLKSREDDMESLAEEVNDARREDARKEAQDELDEKKREYEDNLAKYEKEKADAEKKMDDAENQIQQGERKVKSTRKELNATIKDLKGKIKEAESGLKQIDSGLKKANDSLKDLQGKKSQLEAGIKEANSGKAAAKQAYDAGAMSEDEYKAAVAKADAAISELNKQLSQVNGGIKKANATVKDLKSKKSKTEKGLKKAKDGLSQAEDGLKELDRQENRLDSSERQLRSERQSAETEFEKAEKELDDAKEKLDKAQDKIDEMETGNSYAFSRLDNTGYSSFDSNSSIVDNIAKIFPVFFFLIAALVCMTTMTRMIEEQRGQIGVLKALGYSNSAVASKYLFYSGSAAFLGSVAGFFIGCKVFPAAIWQAYTMMYDFSEEVDYIINPTLGLLSLAVALLCSMGATWYSIRQDFKVAPSELIRPKTPPAGKQILMERITPIWKRISFLYKVSIRNIFRDKKRFLMMVIGVSGCTALLIAGFGIRTTIAKVADYQFEEISLYDFETIFSKNMNAEKQQKFKDYMKDSGIAEDDIIFLHRAETTMVLPSGNLDVTCTAGSAEDFDKFISLHHDDEKIDFPGEGEVVIVSKIAHDNGVKVGDEVTIRDGFREMNLTVTAVADNYVYDSIYISEETYEKGLEKKPEIKSALVLAKEDAAEDEIRAASTDAANFDDVAAVLVNLDMKDSVDKMMVSLNTVIFVVIFSAALLAFIVLYNLTNINITERIREIATIKVLGFTQRETSQYVFRENLFLTAIAAVVGIPVGRWLLGFVIDNIVVKMIFFEPRLTRLDIVMSIILTFVFAIFVNLVMRRRLNTVSMTESLKSVE